MAKPALPSTGVRAPCPPLPVPDVPTVPFLARVYELTYRWVQDEWQMLDTIKKAASQNGKSRNHHAALAEARLTPDTLATKLDNISEATLRRELKKLNAPAPGELIRQARIAYAKHLLIHTRLLIREVAARSGYEDERHFAELFAHEVQCLPSEFRRQHIRAATLTEHRTRPQRNGRQPPG